MVDTKGIGFGGAIIAACLGAIIATLPVYIGQMSIEGKVDQLLQKRPAIELRTENVIGGKAPEKFYKIAGRRVYLEIDGQPIE